MNFADVLGFVESQSFDSNRINFLVKILPTMPAQLSVGNIASLAKLFSFDADRLKMVAAVLDKLESESKNNVRTLATAEVSELLNTFSFGSDKLRALSLLAGRRTVYLDFDILKCFSFDSEKMECCDILAQSAVQRDRNIEVFASLFAGRKAFEYCARAFKFETECIHSTGAKFKENKQVVVLNGRDFECDEHQVIS